MRKMYGIILMAFLIGPSLSVAVNSPPGNSAYEHYATKVEKIVVETPNQWDVISYEFTSLDVSMYFELALVVSFNVNTEKQDPISLKNGYNCSFAKFSKERRWRLCQLFIHSYSKTTTLNYSYLSQIKQC